MFGYAKIQDPKIFFEGQRATCGGMWCVKGAFGQKRYSLTKGKYVKTTSEIGKRIARQVRRAKVELLRIQEIYLILKYCPPIPNNYSYELVFWWQHDPLERFLQIKTEGWRTKKDYYGHSVLSVFKQYRIDLKKKFFKELNLPN